MRSTTTCGYHRIGDSTDATIRFYSKEIRLFLNDLDPGFQTAHDPTPLHVFEHLGSMKDRGLVDQHLCVDG